MEKELIKKIEEIIADCDFTTDCKKCGFGNLEYPSCTATRIAEEIKEAAEKAIQEGAKEW